MKKLTTLAASVALAVAANSSLAAVIDVTATLSATITGSASGSQIGTGIGNYNTSTQLLTLQTDYMVTTGGIFGGKLHQTGQTLINFSTMTGTNQVLSCVKISGFNACSLVPTTPQALASVTGTWESFVTKSSFAGANTTQTWNVTAVPAPVPVPAAAWLFGSALLGLAGAARHRCVAA